MNIQKDGEDTIYENTGQAWSFETNSSSTHSLTICTEEQFEEWKHGEVLFIEWEKQGQDFVPAFVLTDRENIVYRCKYCEERVN